MRATIGRFKALCRLGFDRRGATAIEYALIAGGVSIVILVAVTSIGDSMKTLYFDRISAMF